MSYSTLTNETIPYQTSAVHHTPQLAALEAMCAPYLRSGYKITSHTSSSFVLVRPRPTASVLLALVLLVAPPLLLLYLISVRNGRDDVVCVRINSRGVIEESGDTFTAKRVAWRQGNTRLNILLAITGLIISAIIGIAYFADRSNGGDVPPTTSPAINSVRNSNSSSVSDIPSLNLNTNRPNRKAKSAIGNKNFDSTRR